MQLARGDDSFRRADVVTGDSGSGGAVAYVERREACVVRRVLQVVGRTQRLVHDVDQAAEVLNVLDPVTVLYRNGRPPNARLRVAAHAMRAHQIAGVADAPFDRSAARAIGQPGVHLTDVIVHRLPHGHSRVVVWRGPQHTQLNLVARRVGFGAQEVRPARLDQANYRGAMLFVLLVCAFVLVAPFGVFDQRARNVERVKPELSRQRVIWDRQVAGQKSRFLAVERQAEPVVARFAHATVVKIFDVVSAARDARGLNAFALGQHDLLRHFRRVVRLCFDAHARLGVQLQGPQWSDCDRQWNRLPGGPRRHARKNYRLRRDAVFAPARAFKNSGLISDRRDLQRVETRHRRAVDEIEVGVERMQNLLPTGGRLRVYAEGVGFTGK